MLSLISWTVIFCENSLVFTKLKELAGSLQDKYAAAHWCWLVAIEFDSPEVDKIPEIRRVNKNLDIPRAFMFLITLFSMQALNRFVYSGTSRRELSVFDQLLGTSFPQLGLQVELDLLT
jgi:hypothetical protein